MGGRGIYSMLWGGGNPGFKQGNGHHRLSDLVCMGYPLSLSQRYHSEHGEALFCTDSEKVYMIRVMVSGPQKVFAGP